MSYAKNSVLWVNQTCVGMKPTNTLKRIVVTDVGNQWVYFVYEGTHNKHRFNRKTMMVDAGPAIPHDKVYEDRLVFIKERRVALLWPVLLAKINRVNIDGCQMCNLVSVANILEIPLSPDLPRIEAEVGE